MAKKAQIPSELLFKSINLENENLMKSFLASKKSYKDTYIKKLLQSKRNDNKLLKHYSLDDIIYHIDLLEEFQYTEGAIESFLANIRVFVKYLKKTHPSDFPADFLEGLNDIKASEITFNNPKSKFDSRELTIHQLDAVRTFLLSQKKRWRFTFELYFQLGIDRQDTVKYKEKNYNPKKQAFYEKGILLRKCTPQLIDIISVMDSKDWQTDEDNAGKDLRKIGLHLVKIGLYPKGKNLTYSDIKKTRRKFFLKCPYCNEELENIKDNWVLVKVGDEGSIRLCCTICKGGIV
jgi:hypothetical protein